MVNNNYGLPQGITQEQLDEIKSFNAGLTQAGNKSCPPRSRSSGTNRGLVSGTYPGFGAPYAGGITSSRSGSGLGYTAAPSYGVGPSTPSPIERPITRERGPFHLRDMAQVQNNRRANLDSTCAGTLGGQAIGPPNSAARPHRPHNRSPTRSSVLVSQATKVPQSDPTIEPQQVVAQILQELKAAQVITPPEQQDIITARAMTPPGRQRIVTNMTSDDPTKPWIPAHLHQTSCRVACQQIADMIDMPLSEITSDGISIPASRPEKSAEEVASPTCTFATVPTPAPRQPDVDPNDWLGNFSKNYKSADTEAHVAVSTPNMPSMLSESRWAPAADANKLQNGFATNFSDPAATHFRAKSSSIMDIEMTGNPSPLDIPVEGLSSDSVNEVLTEMPTLADSRWATTTNNYTINEYGWPEPTVSSFSPNHLSQNIRPALSETAPTPVSCFSNQENTGFSWQVSANSSHSTAPLQSAQFNRFNLSQNRPAVFKNNAPTPAGDMQPRVPVDPGYGAPHHRNLPAYHCQPVPSWSNENVQPAQPSSQSTQEEEEKKKKKKKIKCLKDSIWAS